MTSDEKFWLFFWTIVGATLSSIVWGLCWYGVATWHDSLQNGYVQTSIPTTYTTIWTKPATRAEQGK